MKCSSARSLFFHFYLARHEKCAIGCGGLLPYLWPPVSCAMKKNGQPPTRAPTLLSLGKRTSPTSISRRRRYFSGQGPREYGGWSNRERLEASARLNSPRGFVIVSSGGLRQNVVQPLIYDTLNFKMPARRRACSLKITILRSRQDHRAVRQRLMHFDQGFLPVTLICIFVTSLGPSSIKILQSAAKDFVSQFWNCQKRQKLWVNAVKK